MLWNNLIQVPPSKLPRLIGGNIKKPPSGGFFNGTSVCKYLAHSASILTTPPNIPLPPLWLSLWAPLLALAWLLPNHYFPWTSFHADAWAAAMLTIVAIAVIWRSPTRISWHYFPIAIAFLSLLPLIQFSAGILPFSGQAWLGTAYLLGLLITLLIGAHWEKSAPGNAADALFLAIGIAAIVSFGIQLHQWLGTSPDDGEIQIWIASFAPGRPSANLGQPNQLATLLIWSILGCGWGFIRKKINHVLTISITTTLLFGLALTQSRIALISMLLITMSVWFWRNLWPSRTAPWVVTGLFFIFLSFTFFLQNISNFLQLDVQIRSASLGGGSTQLRLKAYSLFLNAAWNQPWWGYGWYQVTTAQLAVAENNPSLSAFFSHSHNLFLDFLLWFGIPIGALVSFSGLAWFALCIRRVSTKEQAVLCLFLLAIGMHAMVEFPLHYGYFLYPAGMVVGILNHSQKNFVAMTTNRLTVIAILLCTTILLFSIVRDYLRIDDSFRAFRLESARIGNLPPGAPPDVFILNDMQAFIKNARTPVEPNINDESLEQLRDLAHSFPSPGNLFNYAKALAYRHKPKDAEAWIQKIVKVLPLEVSQAQQSMWQTQALTQPTMAAVRWPSSPPQPSPAEASQSDAPRQNP